jgi:hypothetical protein
MPGNAQNNNSPYKQYTAETLLGISGNFLNHIYY